MLEDNREYYNTHNKHSSLLFCKYVGEYFLDIRMKNERVYISLDIRTCIYMKREISMNTRKEVSKV